MPKSAKQQQPTGENSHQDCLLSELFIILSIDGIYVHLALKVFSISSVGAQHCSLAESVYK